MDALFYSDQPHISEQVVRILVLLATRESCFFFRYTPLTILVGKPLCWVLLSLPDPGQVNSDGPIQANGLTNRLCSFLVDPSHESPEVRLRGFGEIPRLTSI